MILKLKDNNSSSIFNHAPHLYAGELNLYDDMATVTRKHCVGYYGIWHWDWRTRTWDAIQGRPK